VGGGRAKSLIGIFLACGALSADELTYDGLVQLIQSQQLASIEALLPKLPEEFRTNYSLLHRSRSLQKATYENPRVILFGKDAKLTCAFDGDGDSLECFQFIDVTRTFDFRHVQFPTPQNGLVGAAFSESNQTVDGKISCTMCHAADPRPNWNHYSIWEGAYGRDDDELGHDLAQYASFSKKRAEHPRYRWLVQGPYTKDPYMDLKENRIDIGHRPNLRFSDACGRLNALRTQRILESKVRKWESLAFAIRALQCFLTPEQKAQFEKAGLNFEKDADLGRIFDKVGLSGGAWSTQIFDDPLTEPKHPWEHQSGFGYLSLEIAMAIIHDEARTGDTALEEGLEKMRVYYENRYYGVELEFRRTLNKIVLDPDTFGGHLSENIGYVCPRLTEIFTREYLHPFGD
jgi:hypothetical protein